MTNIKNKLNKLLSAASAICLTFTTMSVQAGMVTDANGNVGYDTAAECDAAVNNGTAKFYQPFTRQKPLLREGEKGVQTARIRDLGEEYKLGACDLGVGRKLGRDGVSTALQGKYIPYSPDMPINAYTDSNGAVVRVTMQQCDNWFSRRSPRPVAIAPAKTVEKVAEPVAMPAPTPPSAPEVSVVENVEETPVTLMPSLSASPYVYGTLGAVHDGVRLDNHPKYSSNEKLNDVRVSGQVGAGVQLNNWVGAEVFYQNGHAHEFKKAAAAINRTFGARATLGQNVTENTRIFAKVGAAGVHHQGTVFIDDGKVVARPTAGIGITHRFTTNNNNNWAVRADYDHVFKLDDAKRAKNKGVSQWQGSNYLGAGLQYNF